MYHIVHCNRLLVTIHASKILVTHIQADDKEEKQKENESAFNAWCDAKKEQEKRDKLLKLREQQERDETYFLRSREECEQAYKK